MTRAMLFVASCALFGLVENASACSTNPPIVTPTLREASEASDIVAVIHVDWVGWRTSAEEAEFSRLWEHPPLDTIFSYPAQSARFSVKRVLKGRIPADALIRSGSISCEIGLAEGRDYVLFADLPAGEDDRISTQLGTFSLDTTRYSAAKLAEVESLLTHSKPPSP